MQLEEAQKLWLSSLSYAVPSTIRKYTHVIRQLPSSWPLEAITPVMLQQLRSTRRISANTAVSETQILRTFFSFCEDQGWIAASPARKLKVPRFRPPERVPYTQQEIIRILSACDQVGHCRYERLRAKAAVLLMRHHGLRISDVILLRRDALADGILHLRTIKTGAEIVHTVSDPVLTSLRNLPVPKGTIIHEYFFWHGERTPETVIADMERLLRAVYRRSGVPKAHNHRFRHTFASEGLAAGGSIEQIAYLLGISITVCLKHYTRFTPAFKRQANDLLLRIGSNGSMNQDVQDAMLIS